MILHRPPFHLLPNTPGSYALLFHLAAALCDIPVGRLGRVDLAPGLWIYCGSAHGPGGLGARLRRHLAKEKSQRWHIDALTCRASPVAVLLEEEPERAAPIQRLECTWIQHLLAQPGFRAPIPGFGSSDCSAGCPAHLVHHPDPLDGKQIQHWLARCSG